MLIFCLGTAAELIKCYPVIHEAHRRNLPWVVLSTGQSPNNLSMQFRDFRLPDDGSHYRVLIDAAEDLHHPTQALVWFGRLARTGDRDVRRALSGIAHAAEALDNKRAIWVVHGDTLSTLGGARLGKRLGLRVAHIEAGMRSGTWFSPFPEELSRRWVSGITSLHFAPNPAARAALAAERRPGQIIETEGNTQLDAIVAVVDKPDEEAARRLDLPSSYAVANLHRFENISNPKHWSLLVDACVTAQRHTPVLFVQHPQVAAKIAEDSSAREQLTNAGVRLLPRLPFVDFARVLAGAKFLLSDGGGNQDECKILGLPCLILRTHTESASGLAPDGPCLLSELRADKIEEFLRDPEQYRRPPHRPLRSPSVDIVDALERALA